MGDAVAIAEIAGQEEGLRRGRSAELACSLPLVPEGGDPAWFPLARE